MKPIWEIEKEQKTALDKLLKFAGTQKRLAHFLEVSPTNVNFWVKRGRISATAAMKAEIVTDGYVKKEELRPDVIDWK